MERGRTEPGGSRRQASPAVLLAAAVVAIDLFVVGITVTSLRTGLGESRAGMSASGQSMAALMEDRISAALDRVDLVLRVVADERARMLRAGRIDEAELDRLLAAQLERNPDLLSLRMTDAEGRVRLGAPAATRSASNADRDYFLRLRDEPEAGLVIGRPVVGRIIHVPMLVAARRLSDPEGGFAGVVFGTIEVSRLEGLLRTALVGPHGVVALRWSDRSLVARVGAPAPGEMLGAAASPAANALLGRAGPEGCGDVRASFDGRMRTVCYRRSERHPFFVTVALDEGDRLAGWRRQAVAVGAVVALFLALTAVGGWLWLRAWRARLATERLALEGANRLRESEELFRTAFEISPDSINLNRVVDGQYVAVNEGFTRLTGWTAAEVLGRTSVELGIWADPADRVRLVKELEARGVVENLAARFQARDGRVIEGLMSARRIDLHGQELLLSITRDLTARKRAEEERDRLRLEVAEAQRLEGLGRLAGGVAHDFNNLLTIVLGCCEGLEEALAPGPPGAREDLDQIRQAGERARDLTRQLLAFARRQVIAPLPTDLAAVIRTSERLLRRALREDVALEVEVDQGLWPVLCDPRQLEQVLLNLALNARDAMPQGGTLRIEARNQPAGPGEQVGGAGGWVRLTVHDTGTGIPPEVQEHLFEPFFTTKGPGQGTGLGLPMVHGIVAQAGGRIQVESGPGQGTSFVILLPRTAQAAVAPAAEPEAAGGGGTETVLVLEDDAQVRAVTLRALRGAGYHVLEAGGAAAALEVVRGHQGPLDLVVTDVIMPGRSGPEAVRDLRVLRPELAVLYVSGYAEDALARRGVLPAGVQLLAKPFTAASLLARVRAVLDAAPPAAAAQPAARGATRP